MIGKIVSHYKILEHLGGGGMGVVYKARDLKLDRHVALKFLPPDLTRDSEARLRFIHEAKAASALQHENICVIHDIDRTADGRTFMVLEYYDGRTIKKEIARGALPVDQAIDVAIQVGEGLAEAHRHGIVHRDIKPANIMLTGQGKARIVDFGVALLTGETRLTVDGHKVGTVTHMSPEQAKGGQVDHRTDIWSLGVLLYEMIAGRLPFGGSYEQAVVYSILNVDPPPLSSLRPEVPARLDDILRRALAKDAGSRYQNIVDMVEDLRLISGRSTASRSTSRITGPSGRLAGSRWWFVGAGAAALILAAAGVWLFKEPQPRKNVGMNHVRLQLRMITNESRQPRADEWARLVQQTYLPNILANRPDIVVFHEGTTEAGADFDLNGEIVQAESAFVLQLSLQEPETRGLRYFEAASFRQSDELEKATSAVARNILWFLQIRVLNQDLDPWMPRMLSDSTTIAFLKAMTYILTGESGGAVFLYEAIRLDWTFVAPRVWLIPGLVKRNEKDARDEAERHYRILLTLKPRVTPFELAMIELAGCYLHGNLQCRVTALEKGLRFAPGNRIVLANLGFAYDRLGKFDHAVEAYEPVVQSEFPYPPAYPEYARVLIKTKRLDEARGVLNKALAIRPVFPDTYNLLAAFAWKDGDSVKARSYELNILEGLANKKGMWGDVCESLGRILIDMDEPQLAVRFLRSAITEKPATAQPRSALARALVQSGDSVGGELEAESALTLNDSCSEAHALLGKICQQRGSLERARAHFRKYLEMDSVTVTALDIQRRLGAIESTQ
jgi:serine/threonine protein kinase/tetratricopeptide (TPR) repeat protein